MITQIIKLNSNMKRVFLFLAMTLTSLAMTVTAQSATIASGTCGDNLTWELTNDGVLTISGTGAMTEFSSRAPWYNYMDQITTVIIGSDVTSIGANAFAGTYSLMSVYNHSSMFFTLGERTYSHIALYADVVINYQYNNVQSNNAPANKNMIYDIDGDGTMEFVGYKEVRNNYQAVVNYGVYPYSIYGAIANEPLASMDLLQSSTTRTIYCLNSNNDDTLDLGFNWQQETTIEHNLGYNLLESTPYRLYESGTVL